MSYKHCPLLNETCRKETCGFACFSGSSFSCCSIPLIAEKLDDIKNGGYDIVMGLDTIKEKLEDIVNEI